VSRLSDHPAFAPSLVLAIGLAALGAAFNLGQQWNRQDRIAEITADLKHRDSILPADGMAREYEIARQRLDRIETRLSENAVADATLRGDLKDTTGRGDSVWTRQAQDQRDIAMLTARMTALEAVVGMVREQVRTMDLLERKEAH